LDVGYWLLVIGYWLLVIGYWLLVIGYWLLVIGYWLLVISALGTGHWVRVFVDFLSMLGSFFLDFFQMQFTCCACLPAGRRQKVHLSSMLCCGAPPTSTCEF
jgi:hypothetical protein